MQQEHAEKISQFVVHEGKGKRRTPKKKKMEIGLLKKKQICKCYSRHFFNMQTSHFKAKTSFSLFVPYKANALVNNYFFSFFCLFENIDFVPIFRSITVWMHCSNEMKQNEMKQNDWQNLISLKSILPFNITWHELYTTIVWVTHTCTKVYCEKFTEFPSSWPLSYSMVTESNAVHYVHKPDELCTCFICVFEMFFLLLREQVHSLCMHWLL